jgi:parvulin-like peptidyl-prolyl isomerase
MPSYAPGGIVAFAKGDTVYGGPSTEADEGEAEAKIDMEKRLAQPAPTTGGIMGATTLPTTPIPSGPTAGRAVQQASGIPDFIKAEYADTEKRMNAPLSSFMAERQAAMREAGVADTSEGQQQQRAEMMAEKANMADEKQRQKYMRLAEFFASWGSTPGPTLVAGLNAMQKTLPNIMADEKDQKKARKEIDKSIADLDNAKRLLAELKGGADFAELARQNSTDSTSVKNGGDVGCFEREHLVPLSEFERAVYNSNVNELTGPVSDGTAYHLLIIYKRKIASAPDLNEVYDQLENEIRHERLPDKLIQIRDASGVATYPERLDG